VGRVVTVRGCEFPTDRYYHADYNVWIREETPGVALIGATAFGVALAIDFVAFMPKPLGSRVEAGRAVGLLELAKTIVSVRTPIAATILAANAAAVVDPGLVRSDPYGGGWLVRLGVDDAGTAMQKLIWGDAIVPAFEEAMRLEDFHGTGRS